MVAGGLAIGGLEKPIAALASHGRDEERGVVLAFETMVGVSGPFVGSANPQRGLNGGGLPWTIAQAEGRLNAGGELKVRVQGLVLANTNDVPAALRGTNPVPAFRAVVSCLTIDAMGRIATANRATVPFPATTGGDAEIEATLALPKPCFAPIIFVTSPTLSWFAVTGM